MEHNERISIAKEICKKIIAKYHPYYVGIYGSVSRNEDKKYSDLELQVVTKEKDWWGSFSIDGLSVWVHFAPLTKVLEQVSWIEPEGSSNTNNLLNSLTLYDRIDLKNKIRQRFRSIDYRKFKKAALVPLGEVCDNVSKMRNAIEIDKRKDMLILEKFILLEQADNVVALLNRKHFTRGGMGHLIDIAKFKHVPKDYIRLSRAIWTTGNNKKALAASAKLADSLVRFAAKHGVKIPSYNSARKWKGI